jgi:hypothetical protein
MSFGKDSATLRRAFATSLVAAALAVAASPAVAGAVEYPTGAIGPCNSVVGPAGQAGTAGTENQVCIGAGAATVGPSVGQIATVAGPTITGPALVGAVVVAAGNAAVG